MKVHIFQPIPQQHKPIVTYYDENIATLAALLRDRGHPVSVSFHQTFRESEVVKALDSSQPEVVLIHLESRFLEIVQQIARIAGAKQGRKHVLIFGPGAPSAIDRCLKSEGVTGLFAGETEIAIPEFLRRLGTRENPHKTSNFCFRLDSRAYRNESGPLVDVTTLPIPDRSFYPLQQLVDKNPTIGAEFYASRGGLFDQEFFPAARQNPSFAEYGPLVRYKRVDDLIDEVISAERHLDRMPLVGFQDSHFCHDVDWTIEFCEKYAARVAKPFWIVSRADALNETLCLALSNAGCHKVLIPIESGNSYLRNIILRRFMPRYQILSAFKNVQTRGMQAVSLNLIGLPYENEDMIIETIKLNRLIKPYWSIIRMFEPLPGTTLFQVCYQKGWLKTEAELAQERLKSKKDYVLPLASPFLKDDRLSYYYENFIKHVFEPKLDLPFVMERETEDAYTTYDFP
ncbi:MAG: hypothetical protein NUW37_13815 [Planctomycetes bacterium]|nr:hypothetical protein [Planctomycetota bacterium]